MSRTFSDEHVQRLSRFKAKARRDRRVHAAALLILDTRMPISDSMRNFLYLYIRRSSASSGLVFQAFRAVKIVP